MKRVIGHGVLYLGLALLPLALVLLFLAAGEPLGRGLTTLIGWLPDQQGKTNWLMVGVVGGGLILASLAFLLGPGARLMTRIPGTPSPSPGAGPGDPLTGKEREDLVNSTRQTLLQSATGVTVVIGVVFTAAGLIYTAKTLDVSREGQITDRYTRATEQLGSDRPEVQLGGIYALQRLALDSERDHPTVVEVLSAFVRERSRSRDPKVDAVPTEIQAAVNVVVKLGGAGGGLDLSGSKLSNVVLSINSQPINGRELGGLRNTNLQLSDLHGLRASGMKLTGSRFDNSILNNAELKNADLSAAHLGHADLIGAKMSGASLIGAELVGADLTDAKLDGAKLMRANFSGATLKGVDLRGADLRGALHLTDQQKREAKTDGSTKY